MAYGMEVWLGIAGKQNMETFFATHGYPHWELSDSSDAWYNSKLYEMLPKLREVQLRLFEKAGFTDCQVRGRVIFATTPLGRREFTLMGWGVNYDPQEMGDEPEQAVFGVNLSSRYYPTYLDWRSPSGTLEPAVFNAEMLEKIEQVRHELEAEGLPWAKFLNAVVVMRHY